MRSIDQNAVQDQVMISPAVENFIEIDGQTYATGKGGKGLFRLIPEEDARFVNEAVLLNPEFRIKDRVKILSEISEAASRMS